MKIDPENLTREQKEAIVKLDRAMKNLFEVFTEVDAQDIPISDSLELIGMEIPLLVKPAVNQLSGKLKQMRKEAESKEQALESA